jgi:UDP-N-acetylglucosamine 4,6-dehydratase (inverting)
MLKNSSILITGGTGSFGHMFVPLTLAKYNPSRLVIFSRDEMKQWEMAKLYGGDDRVRFFIGDVRDKDRLFRALQGIDYVVHAAATKIVPTAEYNPFECLATYVLGAENVINACIDSGVQRVIALSTDKASSPINLYGASKLCSDKLFVAGNHYSGAANTRFSVVRYGNVVGSRGSVVPFFMNLAGTGSLPITDIRMTRFWITLPKAVQFVLDSLERMQGGEIFVPRIPSTTITDLAAAIDPDAKLEIVGIRPGEKLHEEMISENDAHRTYRYKDHFVIAPMFAGWGSVPDYSDGEQVNEGFSYQSDSNDWFLNVDEIKELLTSLS